MTTVFLEEVTNGEYNKFWFTGEHEDHGAMESKHVEFKTAIQYCRFLESIGIEVDYSHCDTDTEGYVHPGVKVG